jgi:Fe-S-cluster containining protein
VNRNSNTRPEYLKLDISTIPCIRCGTCCSKFQPQVDVSEAQRICSILGLNWDRFLAGYIDNRWPGKRNLLIKHMDGKCIFLQSSNNPKQLLCSIHDFKPACCLNWKPGLDRIECKTGLSDQWNLKTGVTGSLTGTRKSVETFRQYLLSLDVTI